jgi:hypothetical protein
MRSSLLLTHNGNTLILVNVSPWGVTDVDGVDSTHPRAYRFPSQAKVVFIQ